MKINLVLSRVNVSKRASTSFGDYYILYVPSGRNESGRDLLELIKKKPPEGAIKQIFGD